MQDTIIVMYFFSLSVCLLSLSFPSLGLFIYICCCRSFRRFVIWRITNTTSQCNRKKKRATPSPLYKRPHCNLWQFQMRYFQHELCWSNAALYSGTINDWIAALNWGDWLRNRQKWLELGLDSAQQQRAPRSVAMVSDAMATLGRGKTWDSFTRFSGTWSNKSKMWYMNFVERTGSYIPNLPFRFNRYLFQ